MTAHNDYNIPMGGIRFKRFGAALMDEAARSRLCESSGSEYDSPDTPDLFDLVNSFIEIECCTADVDQEKDSQPCLVADDHTNSLSDPEMTTTTRNMLLNIFNNNDDDVRKKIAVETQSAIAVVGESPPKGFKRRLMSHLRDRGFDAGLCKSRWEKFGRHSAGEHEYVDVRTVDGSRYIVEVLLAAEFEIARPTTNYAALLHAFPGLFVGKPDDLRKIVRLMCNAIKESMKGMDMQVPPWRRNGYMQAKWFSGYKRTTNYYALADASNGSSASKYARSRSIGFEAVPNVRLFHCTNDRAALGKQGYLTAAFNGEALDPSYRV